MGSVDKPSGHGKERQGEEGRTEEGQGDSGETQGAQSVMGDDTQEQRQDTTRRGSESRRGQQGTKTRREPKNQESC